MFKIIRSVREARAALLMRIVTSSPTLSVRHNYILIIYFLKFIHDTFYPLEKVRFLKIDFYETLSHMKSPQFEFLKINNVRGRLEKLSFLVKKIVQLPTQF